MKGKIVFSGRSLAKTHAHCVENKKHVDGKKVSKQRKQR